MFGIDDADTEHAVRTYVKLLRASRAVLARVEPRMASHALTPTQFGVLEALLHKGALPQRELARVVLTSPGNMTDVIDKLSARGLLERTRDTADRRQVLVKLTTDGARLIESLFPAHAADIRRAMAPLSDREMDQLGALLRRLGMADPQPAC
jgi:MarR family 2-MHQ and catechol resistance regulon transcriptional repressor